MTERAAVTPARNPAFTPGTPRRGRGSLFSVPLSLFALVTRTRATPLAQVLVPDHPPLRCGWSGIGAPACVFFSEVSDV